MLKALAAPLVLGEKRSADWRCGGDGKPGGALLDKESKVAFSTEDCASFSIYENTWAPCGTTPGRRRKTGFGRCEVPWSSHVPRSVGVQHRAGPLFVWWRTPEKELHSACMSR